MIADVRHFISYAKFCDIAVPEDMFNYNEDEYLHWHVFIAIHLGCTNDEVTIKSNGFIIANVAKDKLRSMRLSDWEAINLDLSVFETTTKKEDEVKTVPFVEMVYSN